MTISETLSDVKFVVDADGRPAAALLDIDTWQVIVAMLEEAEDQGLLRSYLARRRIARSPEDMGLIPWEQVEAQLGALGADDDATMG